jgi:serine/threonine protein phosphatase PrpC
MSGRKRASVLGRNKTSLALASAAVIFVVNFIFLASSIPSSQKHLIPLEPDFPGDAIDISGTGTGMICEEYGCPFYPPELTTELHQILSDAFVSQNSTKQSLPIGTSTMAMLTQMGKSHQFNQDRALLISPFVTKHTSSDSFLMAIFDGHGTQGHIVAEYVTQDFPERLYEKLNNAPENISDDDIIRMLNETFVETDIYAPPNALAGGCTGSVTLRRGSKLYFANAGDSQTILVSVNSTGASIPYMTRKDKANLPDERARIEGLEGTIHTNPQGFDPRVIIYSRSQRDTIGLAMSRSIGDWEWKPAGVTAEPIVNVIDLKDHPNSFVIAASDGLWDMRKPQFFANQFAQGVFSKGARVPPIQRLWEVIEKVTPTNPNWYRDDITAIVMKMEGLQG